MHQYCSFVVAPQALHDFKTTTLLVYMILNGNGGLLAVVYIGIVLSLLFSLTGQSNIAGFFYFVLYCCKVGELLFNSLYIARRHTYLQVICSGLSVSILCLFCLVDKSNVLLQLLPHQQTSLTCGGAELAQN